jgi:hypothetical protein
MTTHENEERQELLPVYISALQHYSYCPRQCALIHQEQEFDDNVQKHQSHDQQSHGNWATDGSYPTEAVVSDSTWEAVHNYTNRGYKYLNVALRTNAELVDVDRGNIRGMDLVIKATPALTESKTLYRGVTGGVAEMLLNSEVGAGFQDNGFMSTTGNINTAKFFSSNQSDTFAVMSLDVPKGTKAFQPKKFFISTDDGSDLWGSLKTEDEYVLARGTKFQITGIDKETRTVNVKVRP